MLRSELIEKINKKFSYLTVKETEKLVNLVFLEITHALTEGKRIELRGLALCQLSQGYLEKLETLKQVIAFKWVVS